MSVEPIDIGGSMYVRIHPTIVSYTLFLAILFSPIVYTNTLLAQQSWFGIPTKGQQYLYCIDAVGTDVLYTGGTMGVLYKSTDKGMSWSAMSTGTNHWIMGLDFINEQEGWAAYISGTIETSEIRHTTDGGKTWTPMLGDEGVEFSDIAFLNDQMGWVCVHGPLYYATTNGGKTWQKHTLEMLDTTDFTMKIQFVTPQHGWLSTLHGALLSTADGGKTWQKTSIVGVEDFDFATTTTGWVLYNGSVRKTTDGGLHWASVSLPYTFKLHRIQFKNESEGWILGGLDCSKGSCTPKPVLMHSTDGGATWADDIHPFSETPMAYYDLAFSSDGTLYVSGHGGRVVAREQSAVSVAEPLPSGMVISPNPCPVGSALTIPDNGQVYGYALYDMMGKRVQAVEHNGAPIHTINTQILQTGMYYLRLYNSNNQLQHVYPLLMY